MEKVQVNEVREHLAHYLDKAKQGEEIIITRHAKPVARLTPYKVEKSEFPDLTEFRNSLETKGKPMSTTLIEMRRNDKY